MLASTVQFSTSNQTPPTCPRQTRAPHRGHGGTRSRTALTRSNGCPLPQDPTACLRTGPPPPPRSPRPRRNAVLAAVTMPAELVSVPPSSTTPEARGPPVVADRPVLGAALDHPHEVSGQCSLERR